MSFVLFSLYTNITSQELDNIDAQRLAKLKERSMDAWTAVLWLRNNKTRFKAPIHEPIFMSLSVREKRHLRAVEQAIPHRDLLAFVVEDEHDQEVWICCCCCCSFLYLPKFAQVFLSEVRDKQDLRVNCVLAPRTTPVRRQVNYQQVRII